jgi:hypothetical protein
VTLTSTRPRATRRCTAVRRRVSIDASDPGSRSCRSRNRWLTARTVAVIVAASSSLVSDAKPVMLLIMGLSTGD